ncbi:flagellar biosynthetic protein FliQ [Salmonella enterica subsp. arizonae]|uniref:Flagellar biosynthetic protein FliQ n=1 Tax=Salmonella enterica subsp. arizonae TaxID=59203 RepID=A0A379SLR9_SALER|nr:flagellar biosynthetic protein FliQ [Salmonella enterica subsp. arizonae]
MTPESVMMMGTEAMKVALALAAPLLLVALITGLIISILQAATQINEMTLSFIPKIVAVFIAIIVAGRGCSTCCWIMYALCSAIYLISSDKQRDDTGHKRAMAILAESLFLALVARTGADFNRADS